MGRAARANQNAPRVQCEAERCETLVRTDITKPYIKFNDGTFGYVCDTCYDRYVKEGILYVRPTA